ncbi:MAG: neutral zinc metallopeptidase [Candidatus Saccharimonadales bacterium]
MSTGEPFYLSALNTVKGNLEPSAPSANIIVAPDGDVSVASYLQTVADSLNQMWTDRFLKSGYITPTVAVTIVTPSETVQTDCGVEPITATTNNAYYCPSDVTHDEYDNTVVGQILLPLTTFERMWLGDIFGDTSDIAGDFTSAIIVAHEFSHHVVDEMTQQSEDAGKLITPITGKNNELIADCFAGVWLAESYYDQHLVGDDFEEAAAALSAIGDIVPDNVDPHGTGTERVDALTLGYNNKMQSTVCVTTYWK